MIRTEETMLDRIRTVSLLRIALCCGSAALAACSDELPVKCYVCRNAFVEKIDERNCLLDSRFRHYEDCQRYIKWLQESDPKSQSQWRCTH